MLERKSKILSIIGQSVMLNLKTSKIFPSESVISTRQRPLSASRNWMLLKVAQREGWRNNFIRLLRLSLWYQLWYIWVFSGTGSKEVKQETLPIVIEKTTAWFQGLNSCIPSHITACTRVNFFDSCAEEFFLSCWEYEGIERQNMIKKDNKNNMENLYFIYFTPNFIHKVFTIKNIWIYNFFKIKHLKLIRITIIFLLFLKFLLSLNWAIVEIADVWIYVKLF